VELSVQATVYVLQKDVVIQKGDGSILPFDDTGMVRAVDRLTIHAHACDCDKLPIKRGGEVLVVGIRHIASDGWHNLTLQYSGRENLYSAEIVLQALESSSSTSKKYMLYVQSIARDGGFVTGEVSLGFEVTSTNSTFIVAGSIGAVRSDATQQSVSSVCS
jgi:hypothetical protein